MVVVRMRTLNISGSRREGQSKKQSDMDEGQTLVLKSGFYVGKKTLRIIINQIIDISKKYRFQC